MPFKKKMIKAVVFHGLSSSNALNQDEILYAPGQRATAFLNGIKCRIAALQLVYS